MLNLDRLAELDKKATPPPWEREGYLIFGPEHPASKHRNGRILIAEIMRGNERENPHLSGGHKKSEWSEDMDADFIPLTRNALPDLIARIRELEAANADLYAQLADRDKHEREQAAMVEGRIEQAEAKILTLQIAITEDVTDAEIGATVKKILAEDTNLPDVVTEIMRLRERAAMAEAREAELREALEIVAEGVCPNTECEEVVNRLLSHPRPAILSRLERAEKALREIAALPLESEIKVDEKRVWIEKQTHKAIVIAQQFFEGGGGE